MGIDIKFPIGLMFTLLGLLLSCYGLFTRAEVSMYTPSLGINVNLWSGSGMLAFGLLMLFFSYRSKRSKTK
jgi:hypothetical protein